MSPRVMYFHVSPIKSDAQLDEMKVSNLRRVLNVKPEEFRLNVGVHHTIRDDAILCDLMGYNSTGYKTMQNSLIRRNSVLYSSIQRN